MSGVSGGNELTLGVAFVSNLSLTGILCTALIRRRVMYTQTNLSYSENLEETEYKNNKSCFNIYT